MVAPRAVLVQRSNTLYALSRPRREVDPGDWEKMPEVERKCLTDIIYQSYSINNVHEMNGFYHKIAGYRRAGRGTPTTSARSSVAARVCLAGGPGAIDPGVRVHDS